MRFARTRAVALIGMAGSVVDVEADIGSQLPGLSIIGLPDTALAQASHRVRSAAGNAGIPLAPRHITVNLSPAALPKHGCGFDLAIALACLAAAGDIEPASVAGVVHIGELALDGRLRPVPGVLPAVAAARRAGHEAVMVPTACVQEASMVSGIRIIGVAGLRDAAIRHGGRFEPVPIEPIPLPGPHDDPEAPIEDLHEVIGQDAAVDALTVAAAGAHHLFMLGPPGTGKTMLAARLPGILPDLDEDAAIDVLSVRSILGSPLPATDRVRPPFEAPHHTATAAAMIGGGTGAIRPGAAVRAGHGVLFLDEAPEFAPAVLDVLRQPLESGRVSIHRANSVAVFPARFQLVMAANPCPCGNHGVPGRLCECAPYTRRRYLSRISGPLLDRIDIQLRVESLSKRTMSALQAQPRPTSAELKQRVAAARAAAGERLAGTRFRSNAEVSGAWLRAQSRRPGPSALVALDRAYERGAITLRGYDRVLRVAWSLSDLAGTTSPQREHVDRALFLRSGQS